MSSGASDAGNGTDKAGMPFVLGPRLTAIAALVPTGSVVADIGTDHAALPIALVRAHRVPRAIASEVVPAPLEYARRVVVEAGCASLVDVRFGSGLSVLQPGEAECIVLAGMGAWTILDIIHAHPEVARTAVALVLQPQTEPELVRRTLAQEGFGLLDERLSREGERFYVVMAYRWTGETVTRVPAAGVGEAQTASRGAVGHPIPPVAPNPADIPANLLWEIGPRLLTTGDPLLVPFLRHLAAIEERKLSGQGRGTTTRARAARARTTKRLAVLKRLADEYSRKVTGGER